MTDFYHLCTMAIFQSIIYSSSLITKDPNHSYSGSITDHLEIRVLFVLTELHASTKVRKLLLQYVGALSLLQYLLPVHATSILSSLNYEVLNAQLLKHVSSVSSTPISTVVFGTRQKGQVFE